jgi:FkbM family methyltransferase
MFFAQLRIQRLRGRINHVEWLNAHLPWPVWCILCGSDAATIVRVLAMRVGRSIQFLQIGSNDGVANDPLEKSVKRYAWTGLLVEPMPHLFTRLTANYSGVAGLRFEQVAIGQRNGTAPIYYVDAQPGDPEWVDQFASLDKHVILSHADQVPDVARRIVETRVETVTLPSLVARGGLEKIDLLHVDAEGFDYEILRQVAFDSSWAPKFVIYEQKHLGESDLDKPKALLRSAGYRCINIWPDAFAYRPHRRLNTLRTIARKSSN